MSLKKTLLSVILFLVIGISNLSAQDSLSGTETSEDEIAKLLGDAEKENGSTTTLDTTTASSQDEKFESYGEFGKPMVDCGDKEEELSVWSAFFKGILGGFLALFFPCTFPMIPMTMSFFLKGKDKAKGTRNAILYGFSIFLVYFLLSVPFNFGLLGADALSNFSANIWLNLAFFAIFLVFAFSLFGFFDISLPSSLTNKVDSKSNTSTFLGIFFMAFTLAIVSFSCTGPLLGLVLASAKNVKYVTPAFSGFGIGLGIPFALFALFPKTLNKLPKSGSWMDVIKNVFGYIELAFAFKFLSNVDLTLQWGLLKREVFVVIWIVIFIMLGLYLIGKFSFKPSQFKKTPITWGLAILSFLFSGYLATDFFGGDLRLISGFPPDKEYSIFGHKSEFEKHMNQYQLAYDKAKNEGKLLFIDFTGHTCVNCRKMEQNVWVSPIVEGKLKREFVITSLYVDQNTELPADQKRSSEYVDDKLVDTEGDVWMEFQIKNLHRASQPEYAIIDPQSGRIVNHPISGLKTVSEFDEFLTCALNATKKM